jgi:hypothetical protein
MRRNLVSFRTGLFENKEPKPHFINARCFGEDLIAWLLQRLQGLSLGEPIQEDYGWGSWVENNYWISAGVRDDSIGIDNPEWLVCIDFKPGLKTRLFGKTDPSLHLRICKALHAVLHQEPAITDIRWCDEQEVDCGDTPL